MSIRNFIGSRMCWKTRAAIVLVLSLITIYLGASSLMTHTPQDDMPAVALYSVPNSTRLPITVAGVVAGADQATIRAQAAGTVRTLSVREGAEVVAGTVLGVLDAPVARAELGRASIEGTLALLSRESIMQAQRDAAVRGTLVAADAQAQEVLAARERATNVQDQTLLLLASLEAAATGLVAALDFVDENRSLFPAESHTAYDAVVRALYDTVPQGLQRTLVRGGDTSSALLSELDRTSGPVEPEPQEVLRIADSFDRQLAAAVGMYVHAESRVTDARRLQQSDARYAAYLSHRNALAETLAQVRARSATLKSALESAAQSEQGKGTARTLSDFDESSLATQADFAGSIARAQAQASAAAQQTAAALYELSTLRAPFSGRIAETYVKEGDYVTPGEPLFSLVGAGAQELSVVVPLSVLPYVAPGDALYVGGERVGSVARVAPAALRGGAQVVLSLYESDRIIGDTLRGELMLDISARDLATVPRPYVRFDSEGAYVQTVDGSSVRFDIHHDRGTMLFGVLHADPRGLTLRKAVGLSL